MNLIGSSIYFVNLLFLQFKSDRCTKVVKIILGPGVLFATLPSWVIFTSIQSWSSINRTILISIISIWNEIYNSMSTFLQHVTFSAFDRDEQLLSDLIRLRSYWYLEAIGSNWWGVKFTFFSVHIGVFLGSNMCWLHELQPNVIFVGTDFFLCPLQFFIVWITLRIWPHGYKLWPKLLFSGMTN